MCTVGLDKNLYGDLRRLVVCVCRQNVSVQLPGLLFYHTMVALVILLDIFLIRSLKHGTFVVDMGVHTWLKVSTALL